MNATMLNHLSPREFEEYCQVLLTALHRCQVDVTQQTRDGGRDLLVHHTAGLWVVECKHWPTGTVGRPVVMKLHSAALTANSRRALIITTGRFSQDAEVYASGLKDVAVELIDMAKLAHMISIAFPYGALPSNLSVAIKTTSDGAFPQLFAQSIFSEDRFHRGASAKNPVRVTRQTHYEAFFIARYQAAGSTKTAVGHFSENWGGSIWISANGDDAGFGSPRVHGRKLTRLVPLAQALASVPGDSQPPSLQPHQAVTRLKQFIVANCSKRVWYRGRNNANYSTTITPSSTSTLIESLTLCYIPFQEFTLEIGGNYFEGEVDERGDDFHVDCPALSTCAVCGTATTADNQVLCCICFRPAHRWGLFMPDSYECSKCQGIMCRRHAVGRGKTIACTRCAVNGRPLGSRWLPHCWFGVSSSTLAALSGVIALICSLHLDSPIILTTLIAACAVALVGWIPFLCVISQKTLLAKHKNLTYPKVAND